MSARQLILVVEDNEANQLLTRSVLELEGYAVEIAGSASEVFEVLRERFPSVVIPFNEIVRTARAYKEMGEREREIQVYRATAESSFGSEA